MSASGAIRAGAAYVEVLLEQNKLTQGLTAARARMNTWAAGLSKIGAGTRGGNLPGPLAAVANFAFSPAGLTAGLLTAANRWTEFGDSVAKSAARAGVGAEELSALRYAASQSDVSAEQLEGGLVKLAKTVGAAAAGGEAGAEALAAVGTSAAELANLRPEQQMGRIADGIQKIQNPTERTTALLGVFGKSGAGLAPLLLGGAAGITELTDRARELGLTISDKEAAQAEVFGDLWSDLKDTLQAGARVIGGALIPHLQSLVVWAIEATKTARQWLDANKGLFLSLFKVVSAVTAAGFAFTMAGRAVGLLANGLGMALTVGKLAGTVVSLAGSLIATVWAIIPPIIAAVGAALTFLATPAGLVTAAVIAGGAALFYFSGAAEATADAASTAFQTVKADALSAFGGIRDALAKGDIALAGKVALGLLKLEWARGCLELQKVWSTATAAFKGGWDRASTDIARVAVAVWGGLQKGWNLTCWAFTTAWRQFVDFVADTWGAVADWVESKWVDMQESVGALDEDEATAKREAISSDRDAEKADRAKQVAAAQAATDRQYNEQRAAITRDTDAIVANIEDDRDRRNDSRWKDAENAIQARRDEVDAARKELSELVTEAGKAPEKEAEARRKPFQRMGTDGADTTRTTTTGTFNAFSVAGMGSSAVMEKINDGIKQVAQHTLTISKIAQTEWGQVGYAE